MKKLIVAISVFVLVYVFESNAFAVVPFPKLMALERINQQLSAPAPELLPATPRNFGPNIAGLVSWCKADMAMDYALKNNCANGISKDPMITTLKGVIIGEHRFKDDITKALQMYRNKDAEGLLKHLAYMSRTAKNQKYPLVFDNVMNQLYDADLNDAVHPYRMMIQDLQNDWKKVKKYLGDDYNDRMSVWENF